MWHESARLCERDWFCVGPSINIKIQLTLTRSDIHSKAILCTVTSLFDVDAISILA